MMADFVQERVTPGSLVLDAGCGAGATTSMLDQAGFEVEAIDLTWNAEMEQLARESRRVTYSLVDIAHEQLPFQRESFQAVICLEVLEHLRNPWAFIESVSKVLTKGGWLFLSIPNYWNIKYRIRYLLTGNIQRPFDNSTESMNEFRAGQMPHVNTLPWPVLKYALKVYDLSMATQPFPEKVYSWKRNLPFLPLVTIIKIFQNSLKKKQGKYLMQETNSLSILLGGPHVFIIARKESF